LSLKKEVEMTAGMSDDDDNDDNDRKGGREFNSK